MSAESQRRFEHLGDEDARRVMLTITCRDTDAIEKVDGAGETFERDGQQLQRMHNGVVIEEGCYYGPWMTEVIRDLRGHHEPQEELVFHEIVERIVRTESAPTMIELGSFWAYYSLWFASRSPRARVVALEPDPVNLDVGRRNFALNDLASAATFVHGAMGAAPGREAFAIERTGEQMTVDIHDLRSLMDVAGFDRASLLLSDIQGAETLMLDRARGELEAGRVRFVVVSTHHHSMSGSPLTHQDARELLVSCGAHVIAEHSVGESFSGDGLIAASFDERDRDMEVEVSRARHCDSLFGELEYDLDRAWQSERRVTQQLADTETRLAARWGIRLSRWFRARRFVRARARRSSR